MKTVGFMTYSYLVYLGNSSLQLQCTTRQAEVFEASDTHIVECIVVRVLPGELEDGQIIIILV